MKIFKNLKEGRRIKKDRKFWKGQMEFLNSKMTKELFESDREAYEVYEALFVIAVRQYINLQ